MSFSSRKKNKRSLFGFDEFRNFILLGSMTCKQNVVNFTIFLPTEKKKICHNLVLSQCCELNESWGTAYKINGGKKSLKWHKKVFVGMTGDLNVQFDFRNTTVNIISVSEYYSKLFDLLLASVWILFCVHFCCLRLIIQRDVNHESISFTRIKLTFLKTSQTQHSI